MRMVRVPAAAPMRRGAGARMASLLLAMLAAAMPMGGPARAGAPTPICKLPGVIERMTAELGGNPYYTRLDPRLILETPLPDPRLVRCTVCADILLYDTARFGDAPLGRCEPRSFTVRALRNGFVLDPSR